MTRPLRIEYHGALHHVTARGNERRAIFGSDHDRSEFLDVLAQVVAIYNWRCYAFCLMDNHYHILIETPDANLSKGMRDLNGIYAQRFNRVHGRDGHLFQGRFHSIVVDRDSYLLEVARYIVLNPVRAKIVPRPVDWKWSSYRATAGFSKPADALSIGELLKNFGSDRHLAVKEYRRFVKEGIDKKNPFDDVLDGNLLGIEPFSDNIWTIAGDKSDLVEVPISERMVGRPTLLQMFSGVKSKNDRDDIIVASHGRCKYSQKEIADFLGVHYSTISKVIANSRFKT